MYVFCNIAPERAGFHSISWTGVVEPHLLSVTYVSLERMHLVPACPLARNYTPSGRAPLAEGDLRHASTMTTDLSYTALQMRYNTGVLITLSLIGVVLAHELPRHLARQIESVQPKRQKESVSTTSLCDHTLSFTEIYYTIPSAQCHTFSRRPSCFRLVNFTLIRKRHYIL